jgi:transposase
VNECGQPRLTFEVNEEALADAAKLDGKALFDTTRDADRLSPASVCLACRDRDAVESFIRTTKQITDLRPYYVRLEQKIRALVFFCVIGVHLIAALQLELEEAGIDITGVQALEKLRGIRRVEMTVDGEETSLLHVLE